MAFRSNHDSDNLRRLRGDILSRLGIHHDWFLFGIDDLFLFFVDLQEVLLGLIEQVLSLVFLLLSTNDSLLSELSIVQ